MVNLQWISEKYLRNPLYYEGIEIIPMVMLGALFLGIYLNLSIWYKLSDQTRVGLYISIIGALITIGINFFFIPEFGYWASASAALVTFFSMMVISYIWGRIAYPIPYNTLKGMLYIIISVSLSMLSFYYFRTNYYFGNALLVGFLIFIGFMERETIKRMLKVS